MMLLTRKKIWELESRYHCSIIGICLSKYDVEKLARKFSYSPSGDEPYHHEHQLHIFLVSLSSEKSGESKFINKYLDKKYKNRVKEYTKLKDDDSIWELFLADMQNDRISGSYWAVMTHPSASEALIKKIYGKIHMLSHYIVPKHFKYKTKLQNLVEEAACLKDRMEKQYVEFMRREKELLTRIRELEKEAKIQASTKKLLNQMMHQWATNDNASQTQSKSDVKELKDGSWQATNNKRITNKEIKRLKKENLRLIHSLEKKEAVIEKLESETENIRKQIRFLKNELNKPTTSKVCSCKDKNTEKCPGPDLCGKRLLYVGGQNSLIPYYKKIAQKHGAVLFHHDGGKEVSVHRLPSLLSKADAVICPLDCISHEACICVKKICKKSGKPFIPIKSSGISSLAKCLEGFGERNN